MSLQAKLITSKLLLTVIPAVTIAGIIFWKTSGAMQVAKAATATGYKESYQMTYNALIDSSQTDLAHVADNIRSMCETQQEVLDHVCQIGLA
jgi:hypothetical protein